MMNGIWFNNIHSYQDLNLVLSECKIPPAAVKTNYVDIPGGDGSVDLTEAQGDVKFKDRDCSFTFTVFPDEDFEEKKTHISNLLNGKRCNLMVDKDPSYFWKGRCFINEYASDKNLHKIVMGAILEPYKLKIAVTEVNIPSGTNVVRTLENARKKVIPTITTTANAKIVFEGNTLNLGIGTYTPPEILLKYGSNQVTVTSTASVKFTYQEGDL